MVYWRRSCTICNNQAFERRRCPSPGSRFAVAILSPLRGARVRASSIAYDCGNTDTSAASRLRSCRHLGVRPRQHALPTSRQSLAAGGRAHPRLHRRLPRGHPRGSVPAAEGLLQALRHLDARADDRAWHEARRFSGFRAPGRSFAAGTQSGAGYRDRKACRAQADPHERHPPPCRRGACPARARCAFRRRVRHRCRRAGTQAVGAHLRPVSRNARRRCRQGRHVRGSRAQPRGAARLE